MSATSILPDLPTLKGNQGKENFSRFAALNIDGDKKDDIYRWWKLRPKTQERLSQLRGELNKPTLPGNERTHAERVSEEKLKEATEISNMILGFLQEKPGPLRRFINLYASVLGTSSGEDTANQIAESIEQFNESQEDLKMARAVCAAINETRSYNADELTIRKKVSQSVFDEMFDQLAQARIVRKKDIDLKGTGIIDSPETEEIDLKSTLSANPWTGDERRKALRKYNKLKRVMDKLGTDTEYKVAFNTLWKWANGKIPQDASVFKILEYTENLYGGVTDTLTEAWDMEAEREEDDEEAEDE